MPSASTYEQMLIYNARRVTIKETFFANLENVAIGLGLYQWLRDVTVRNCTFTGFAPDDGIGAYYSQTCRNFKFVNCHSQINTSIQGANFADNETFPGRRAVEMSVVNCYVRAAGTGTGIQVGAVQTATVKGSLFWLAELFPLNIHRGNGPDAKSNSVTVKNNRFIDSNHSNGLGYYDAGVLIQPGNDEDISDYTLSQNYFKKNTGEHMVYGITVDATGIHNTAKEPVHTNNHVSGVTEIHYAD